MFHALIRTHHITSRKKIAALKAAAKQKQCFVLLRTGGIPGLMYVRGTDQSSTQQWVDTVHKLRYKDYQLISPVYSTTTMIESKDLCKLEEVSTVKEFAARIEQHGITNWWRTAMGFKEA